MAIEFALVGLLLFFPLLMGILEYGLIFYLQSILEGSVSVGSRIGKTGYSEGVDREAYLRQVIVKRSGNFLDPAKLDVRLLNYASFQDINPNDPCINLPSPLPPECRGRLGPGAANGIVLYRATYNWTVITPYFWPFIGDGRGNYQIQAVATVRNEGF